MREYEESKLIKWLHKWVIPFIAIWVVVLLMLVSLDSHTHEDEIDTPMQCLPTNYDSGIFCFEPEGLST